MMKKKKAKSAAPRGGASWRTAAAFAARAHRHQVRRDGSTPYFAHVSRVALTVVTEFGCVDPEAITAALLHDTIEDTTTDFEDIETRFGAGVASMVVALTKNMAMREPEREEDYDRRLAAADWRVRLIKAADACDNLWDVSSHPARELARRRKKTIEHARRAAGLIEADAKTRPESARALQLLRGLIRST